MCVTLPSRVYTYRGVYTFVRQAFGDRAVDNGETGRVGRYRELKPGLSRADNSQSLLHEISRSCLSTIRTFAHRCAARGTHAAQRSAEPSAARLRETRAARPRFVIDEISSIDRRDEICSAVEVAFSSLSRVKGIGGSRSRRRAILKLERGNCVYPITSRSSCSRRKFSVK